MLCRADGKEGADGALEAVGFGGELVALQALDALFQFIVETLLFFCRQAYGEGLACTQIVEVQFEGLARVKLAIGLGVEQFARSGGRLFLAFREARAHKAVRSISWLARLRCFHAINRQMYRFARCLYR